MISKYSDQPIEDFNQIKISVASPEDISNWSHGEVIKPETINYRTQKPERDGLFDERIFGPTKDYECYCGKYKKIRFKGVICDKCGVEVTKSSVRRERMGHIELAVPIAHIWYVHGIPSVLGLILDMSMSDLEKVIYFSAYIIVEVNHESRQSLLLDLNKEYEELKQKKTTDKLSLDQHYKETKKEIEGLKASQLLTETKYHEISMKYGNIVKVGIGAEALYNLLTKVDVGKEIEKLVADGEKDVANKRKILRRLRFYTDLHRAGIKPQWVVLRKLPVLPPDLRPMVQLDGGRFAASDLNDLYRRVINRNNRLKRLLSQGAPEVITRNEKRMLQEAVDALIDNAARHGKNIQTAGAGTRKLRSLSDMLRGKQGRFRQNLLGKRVDYSGRSVIVAGPQLKLSQCGLPKIMALEMFKPFVISKLVQEGHVHNVKNASKLIEQGTPEVWEILERITSKSYVLLNRAPTLHRLGIEAFQPVLIEGKAIQVHPLVCYAFNADFDGDQMAVHVPLSEQSKWEAEHIMQASKNLLKPASGEPVVQARYDIVFGCFYLTRFKEGGLGENKLFANKNEAILAYHSGEINVRAKINVRIENEKTQTSVGRILFNNILPEGYPFINEVMDNKKLKNIVTEVYDKYGSDITSDLVDKIKDLGFDYAAISGLTISMDDVYSPKEKTEIVKKGDIAIIEIDKQYQRGLITDEERILKTVELWQDVRSKIEKAMIEGYDKESSIYLMVSSGARGSFAQVIQMGGMKGLVVNPTGEIITLPIKSNFKEGLDVYEYFISTHGARKGKSDTSLRTSDAGYLTRRLVDVSQDNVISIENCETKCGVTVIRGEGEEMGRDLASRLVGRAAMKNININNKKVVSAGEIITPEAANMISNNNINQVELRSPLGCVAGWGICQKCYGIDLATNRLVKMGTPVGIMAAQAIGEPGTQLTMKTFHLGGVSGGEDITSGLPRVEELFEARSPKYPAVISEIDGVAKIKENINDIVITIISSQLKDFSYPILEEYKLEVKDGDFVSAKQAIATGKDKKTIRAQADGKVKISGDIITVSSKDKIAKEYIIPINSTIIISDGDKVEKGQLLTDDHINLVNSLELRGVEKTQAYIIDEIQNIYMSQGQVINDKHIELIIRQMFSKVKVVDGGDSDFLGGQIIDKLSANQSNEQYKKEIKKPIVYEQIILGISRIALKTESFLSAASFQETTGILLDAAIKGQIDTLKGLKENVIIGRLIPAGTGLTGIPNKENLNADD